MVLKRNKIVGIDLGTTNSVIAVLEGGVPTIIPNIEGMNTTPSILAYTLNGGILIGECAKRQGILNPVNTFSSVKRLLGCKYYEIENKISFFSYRIKKDKKGNVKLYLPFLKKLFSPEKVSALILKRLILGANRFLKEKITNAVITVPAYFNGLQRLATKKAGALAGIKVLRLLNEPAAAALAYGLENKVNEIILIFDLGGGTLDVSVLEIGDDVFEVLSVSGDTYLGGDDFDRIIVNYILEIFLYTEGINLSEEKEALQRIFEVAEKAKIELSNFESTRIVLPFIYSMNLIPKHIDLELSRSKFEKLSQVLIERCRIQILKALSMAEVSSCNIDQVILVGGATRISAIQNLLHNMMGKSGNSRLNPDEAVALGAAIQAGILYGEITNLILLDVIPLSLSIETEKGSVVSILKHNTPLPAKQSVVFSTQIDAQDSISIHILQGESRFAKDNRSVGLFILQGILPAPRGIPRIRITFHLDIGGILYVYAYKEYGRELFIRVESVYALDANKLIKVHNKKEVPF